MTPPLGAETLSWDVPLLPRLFCMLPSRIDANMPGSGLTICVCVRDGETYVDRCLEPLLAQAADRCVPIVIVDHLSRDATPERLGVWSRRATGIIQVLRFEGEGLGAARNHAWRRADTPWVAFVDVDCEVDPGWIDVVLAEIENLEGDARCAGFGGGASVPVKAGRIYRGYSIFLSTYVGGHNSILNRTVTCRQRVDHVPTLNVVYRRSALEAVGGFREIFVRVGEDIDLSHRLHRVGYELWAVPGMQVEHALRPSLLAWVRNMFLYGRGRLFFIRQNPGSFEFKFVFPIVAVLGYAVALSFDVFWLRRPLSVPVLWLVHVGAAGFAILPETLRQGEGPASWFLATTMLWMTHLAYGAGFIREVFSDRRRFAT